MEGKLVLFYWPARRRRSAGASDPDSRRTENPTEPANAIYFRK